MRRFFTSLFAFLVYVSPVLAGGTLTTLGIGPGGVAPSGPSGPPTLTYTGSVDPNTCVTTSCTYTSAPLSTADPNRNIIVGVSCTLSDSVTVAGVSASVVYTGGGWKFWLASVPTGTSGDITVTSPSACTMAISVYAMYNASSTTPNDTQSTTDNTSPTNVTLAATTNGVAIVGFTCIKGASTDPNPSFSGTVTTDFDYLRSVSTFRFRFMSVHGTASGANITATATYTSPCDTGANMDGISFY